MPTFTLDRCTHPFIDPAEIDRCFAIDIVLPDLEENRIVVQGYVGPFRKSLVSAKLAERLGFDLAQGKCNGEVVVQSNYEGAPIIHRSGQFEVLFSKANPMTAGEAYIHLDRESLERSFVLKDYDGLRPNGKNLFFLALFPHPNRKDFCIQIPLERS